MSVPLQEKGKESYITCDTIEERKKHQTTDTQKSIKEKAHQLVHTAFTPSFFVVGGEALQAVTKEMEVSQRLKPLSSIQFASSPQDAIGLSDNLLPSQIHEAIVLEPIDPASALGALKTVGRSSLKAVFLLYGETGKNNQAAHKEYFNLCKQKAQELSLKLSLVHVHSRNDVKEFMAHHTGRRNAFFSLPHLIDESLCHEMVMSGNKLGLLTLAPSLAYAHLAPLAIGIHEASLSKQDALFEKQSASLFIRYIPAHDLYVRSFNRTMLKKMGYDKGLKDIDTKTGGIIITQ